MGLFVEYVGSTFPVHRIDKKAVREWKDLLLRYGTLPQGMLEQRVEFINAIAYPGLKLDHLQCL